MKHVSILFEFAFKYLTLAQLMISQQLVYCFSTIRIWRSAQPGFLQIFNILGCSFFKRDVCQEWDSNPRREDPTATWTQRLRLLGHPDQTRSISLHWQLKWQPFFCCLLQTTFPYNETFHSWYHCLMLVTFEKDLLIKLPSFP